MHPKHPTQVLGKILHVMSIRKLWQFIVLWNIPIFRTYWLFLELYFFQQCTPLKTYKYYLFLYSLLRYIIQKTIKRINLVKLSKALFSHLKNKISFFPQIHQVIYYSITIGWVITRSKFNCTLFHYVVYFSISKDKIKTICKVYNKKLFISKVSDLQAIKNNSHRWKTLHM